MIFVIAAALLLHSPPVTFEQKPCATVYTPNSVLLQNLPDSSFRYGGIRPRVSTCGGVAWFQGNRYLFVSSMETSSLQIYSFHEVTKQITPVYDLTNKDGLNLRRPESICISKDETLIAIPNMRSGKLQIYGTKEDTFINPVPRITIKSRKLHGAGFSPDGKSISFTGFGEPAGVYTASLMRLGEQLHTSPIQFLLNQYEPLKPKSVAFSPDGRFAAIGYCIQLSREEGPPGRAILAIYHRDPETGWIDPSPISKVEDLFSAETVAFYPDGSCIFVVDQLENRITAHVFDKETGELGESWIALENPEAELNFCHGIAITADGKYVAITNYGDDKITVYERKSDGRF